MEEEKKLRREKPRRAVVSLLHAHAAFRSGTCP